VRKRVAPTAIFPHVLELFGVLAAQYSQHFHAVIRLRYGLRLTELLSRVKTALLAIRDLSWIQIGENSFGPIHQSFEAAKTYMMRQIAAPPLEWLADGVKAVMSKADGTIGRLAVTQGFMDPRDAFRELEMGYPLQLLRQYIQPNLTQVRYDLAMKAKTTWETLVPVNHEQIILIVPTVQGYYSRLLVGTVSESTLRDEICVCEYAPNGAARALLGIYEGETILALIIPDVPNASAALPKMLIQAYKDALEFKGSAKAIPAVAILIQVPRSALELATCMFPGCVVADEDAVATRVMSTLTY
jgi:hypothetical protein